MVDSGSTGAWQAMSVMGVAYFAIMCGALTMRRPAKGYAPNGWKPPVLAAGAVPQNVNVDVVMKTPQFQRLALMFFCVGCGGMVHSSLCVCVPLPCAPSPVQYRRSLCCHSLFTAVLVSHQFECCWGFPPLSVILVLIAHGVVLGLCVCARAGLVLRREADDE